MRVTKIDARTDKNDKKYWWVTLEGLDKNLYLSQIGDLKEGDDFDSPVKLSSKGTCYVPDSPKRRARTEEETRNPGMALSYAKDLVIADKIPLEDIFKWASNFVGFMSGRTQKSEAKASPLVEAAKKAGAIEMITDEQTSTLAELQKSGIVLLPFVKKQGWDIKKISDLTRQQANTLIDLANQEKERGK